MTQIILHNAFSFYQEGFLKSFNQFIEYRHARFFLNEKMKLSKWEDKDMTKEIMNAMNTQIFGVWFLIGAALVFWMQAGFAMVEAGFTRAKNAGNIIMKNLMDFCIGTCVFILIGFSLLLGEDMIGLIGKPGFDIFTSYANFDWSSFVFNLVFCATTATIVSGAMAERTKFLSYCIYSAVISALIYPIEAHWIWGGGWLSQMGFHDFAGSCAIHMVGGLSALIGAKFLGPRIGKFTKDKDGNITKVNAFPGHNIPLGALGVFILWLGWYGFNAGSALAADGLAAHAFMTSAISSAAALVSWMLIDVIKDGKPTLVGASTGLVVGLVAITPGAGFVPIWSSYIIGTLVSPICYFTMNFIKHKLKIDDALDAFGCHGIGGVWGGIATGLFAKTSINSVARWDGLVFGNVHLFVAQVLSIIITAAVAVVGTLICIGIIRIFTPLRVDQKEEALGLDISQHGENAYPSFNGFD